MLSEGQQLEILELSSLYGFAADRRNNGHDNIFTLPCLRDLFLHDMLNETMICIIDRFKAPHLQSLSISDTENDEEPTDGNPALTKLSSGHQSASLSEALLWLVSPSLLVDTLHQSLIGLYV